LVFFDNKSPAKISNNKKHGGIKNMAKKTSPNKKVDRIRGKTSKEIYKYRGNFKFLNHCFLFDSQTSIGRYPILLCP